MLLNGRSIRISQLEVAYSTAEPCKDPKARDQVARQDAIESTSLKRYLFPSMNREYLPMSMMSLRNGRERLERQKN
ncbi:hypothetical protein Patl1_22470 [Pistacia atlantica]|uniref:Uncharacterized protein n=1 Tax=Pistacia atlantica TaxID=434234 RepID=A0ACC0ZZD9_9ROSI|nr:hypothetical protein Patl1_22470 [Pistacia atlantica]